MLATGTCLGKYRVVRCIGRGASGVVYLAEDETLARQVALKVLDGDLTALPDFEQRFRAEARLVAQLEHPNIIGIHALERVNGSLFIDMPYVARGSLADAEYRGDLRLAQVVKMAAEALSALSCCHQCGIVHRDVKPSNILVGNAGQALLTDFGLSKLLSEQGAQWVASSASSCLFVGTPRYAPPEAWDDVDPTPAWDVYSVGMVLYEAALGRFPYSSTTPLALLKEMLERPAPPLSRQAPGVSRTLGDVVDRMVSTSAEERPSDAGAALALLAETPELSGEGAARVTSTAVRLRRPRAPRSAPRRWPWVAALAVLLVFMGGLATRPGWRLEPGSAPVPAVSAGQLFAAPGGVVLEAARIDGSGVDSDAWLMRPGSGEGRWEVIGLGQHGVCWLDVARVSPDSLRFTGHWAEYRDAEATVFRHGSIEGTGRWLPTREGLTAALAYRCDQDGRVEESVLTALPAADLTTPEAFLRGVESDAYALPLLYRELRPRGLAWGEGIARSVARDRTAWVEAGWAQEGMGAYADLEPGALRADLDGERLYLAVTVPACGDGAVVSLCLLAGYSVPLADSPRLLLRSGEQPVLTGAVARVGAGAPELRATPRGGGLLVTLAVPYGAVGLEGPPAAGQDWRANLQVHDEGCSKLVVGWPDLEQPEHGVIVHFPD